MLKVEFGLLYIARRSLQTAIMLFLLMGYVKAQHVNANNHPRITIEHFGTENGLSQGLVRGFAFDSRGYIWMATKDGLNRYDGLNFKVYRHNPTDSTSIAEDFVNRVYADSREKLWLATINGSVDCFDPETEIFHHIVNSFNKKPDANCFVSRISEDYFGNIIVRSNAGVKVISAIDRNGGLHKSNFNVSNVKSAYSFIKHFDDLADAIIVDVISSEDSVLYILTSDLVYAFTKEDIVEGNKPTVIKVALNNVFICDGYSRRKSHLFLYVNNVIKVFNPLNKLSESIFRIENLDANNIPCSDAEGNFWFIGDDKYLMRIDVKSRKIDTAVLNWQHVEERYRYAIGVGCFDVDENLWIATNGYGFLKLNTKQCRFKPYTDDYVSRNSKSTVEDRYMIRVAVKGNSTLYDKALIEKWKELTKYRLQGRSQMPKFPTNATHTSDGYFWRIGRIPADTQLYLVKERYENGKCMQVPVVAVNVMPYWSTGPIFVDNDDEVWFSYVDVSYKDTVFIYHFNEEIQKLEKYGFPGKYQHMGYKFISDWYQEPGGLMWFATTNGIYSFEPKRRKWRHYVQSGKEENIASTQIMLSVCPDPVNPDTFIWFGTQGQGVYRLNKKNGALNTYTNNHGLPNNVVYSIMSDNKKNLWLSTNSGLCLLNTQTFKTRIFTAKHGLPDNEFNRYYYSKDNAGNHYLSNMGGFVKFNPDDFYENLHPSKIVINSLKLTNKEVEYKQSHVSDIAGKFSLNSPIEYCSELEFRHDQNMFTLGFALLDLTIPEQNRYRYILEGFNDDWINAGPQNEATFTNLNPGTYTFKVVGRNSNGVWSAEPAQVKIKILSPWWQTWWFRLFIVLLISAALYTLYRVRLYQVLKLERMRNDIAQDLHDEIGSSLSSISLYATVMQKTSAHMSPKADMLLNKMIKNISAMMESMNDIVWATKADNDTIQKVINRMRAFGVNTLEAKGVVLNFNADIRSQQVKINMQQRKNLYMLYKEAINNAIKHSGCSILSVDIIVTPKKLELSIEDNGTGFNKELIQDDPDSMGGNGLEGMESRARQISADLRIDSTEGVGTAILLVLNLK